VDINVPDLLTELQRIDCIRVYGDGKYIWIPKFEEHQSPHPNEKKYPSKCPDPNDLIMDVNDNVHGQEHSGTSQAGSSGPSGPSGPSYSTAAQAAPGNGKSKPEPPPNVARILRAYARVCELRPDWIPQPGPPGAKELKRLIELRAGEPDFMENLGKYVKLVSALDWAEAKSISFFLRRRTFDSCLSGAFGPSRKTVTGQPYKDPDVYDWATEQQNKMLREKGIIP
jgi:hypothetical protein